jgi:hypothetical protein
MLIPPLPFKVKTTVSWPGEEEGDLGFIENEIVEVYSIVDESWWSGKLKRNNAEGIFPKDYVEIIEDRSNHNSLPSTPVKQLDYDSMFKKTQSSYSKPPLPQVGYSSRDISFDTDNDDCYNTTFDQIEVSQRRSKNMYAHPKKVRSANNLISSKNHPKMPQQHDYRDREKEIANFKRLQLQQNYHVKNTNFDQLYRESSSPNKLRSLIPDSYSKFKSQSYVEVSDSSFLNSANNSPDRSNKHNFDYTEYLNFEQISQKRAQLEMELAKLKALEKIQKKSQIKPPTPKANYSYIESIDSGSEDLISSRKNCSRDDLSKKLSKHVTDEDDSDSYDSDNCPPPPPKHFSPRKSITQQEPGMRSSIQRVPFDADDFRFSGANYTEDENLRLSVRQEELKNSIKSLQSDVLNLSELSATSAGSFFRHKHEKELQLQEQMRNLTIAEGHNKLDSKEVMDSIFQDKKSRHPNIFKKLLQKKKEEDNLIEQKLQLDSEADWAAWKQDLNRMNSLISQDKQRRTKRVVNEESSLVIKPLDYISDINTNETVGNVSPEDEFDARSISFSKADKFMENYSTTSEINELISDVSLKFHKSPLHQIRCILVHLSKFRIIEEPNKIVQVKPKLNDVLQKGEASVYQINYIFKKVLDALRIPSEIVLGFWKKPNEFYHNDQYVINHCWLSILVENHLLIMDIFCFKNGSVCNIKNENGGYNEFYFLAKPLDVVSTHIPSVIDLQHVRPPIDPSVAFYLPREYSGFHKNNLKFRNFNNALTRLKDLEIFEFELEVPIDVELFTLIKTSKVTTNELSLCQIKWHNNKRIAKIKAILPETETIGVLQIFAGPKGLQKYFDNIHELAIVIPLYHSGISKPTKFIPRFPTVQSQNNDLYVKQPQVRSLNARHPYNFSIEQFPSEGLNSPTRNNDFKVVIESPSGKYYKLEKSDPTLPYGSYESNIKCQEPGIYRGLVIGDTGISWYVFAQWECA